MGASVATLVFTCFSLWLFLKDAKQAKCNSAALWIPIFWAFIIGTKSVSLWLGMSASYGSMTYVEDLLIDKVLFLGLVLAAVVVLARRKIKWGPTLSDNAWLFVFFFYLCASILWSDEPMSSFKRWIKDFGNVLMVLVILSEEDPVRAVRTFFARCAFILIPLGVLVVKYYSSISMQFSRYSGDALFVGISTNKNIFGLTICVCSLGLFWLLLGAREPEARRADKTAWMRYAALLVMTLWLERKAQSSTAIACTGLGCMMMAGMKFPAIRKKMKHLGAFAGGAVALVVILQVTGLWDELTAMIAAALGRDPTFHGRTEIWAALMKQDINPVLGTGYYSFWTDARMNALSEGYHYKLNEAHNGYIETYLNSGVIGVFLLLAVLAAAARDIKKAMVKGDSYAALRFAFLLAVIFYGISEAIFNRLSMMWFAVLLAMMTPPRLRGRKRLQENAEQEQMEFRPVA